MRDIPCIKCPLLLRPIFLENGLRYISKNIVNIVIGYKKIIKLENYVFSILDIFHMSLLDW